MVRTCKINTVFMLVFFFTFILCGLSYSKERPQCISLPDLEKYLAMNVKQGVKINSKKLAVDILRVAYKQKISPKLLASLVIIESSGDPKSKRKACIGLTQVNHNVWGKYLKELGVISRRQDLFHPRKSLEAGAIVYKKYLESFNKYRNPQKKALIAYSGGSFMYYNKIRKHINEISKSMKG